MVRRDPSVGALQEVVMVGRLRCGVVLAVGLLLGGCDGLRAVVVEHYPNAWDEELGTARAADASGPAMQPIFDGKDAARSQLPVALAPLVTGLVQPTDVQFPPGRSDVMMVAEKEGRVRVFDVSSGTGRDLGALLELSPPSESEQGVLGLALHPSFGSTGGRLYVHHTVAAASGNAGRVSVTDVSVAEGRWTAGPLRTVLELAQPYANHNGGQLQFGPDGMLYVGFGDGGWRDDPHGHGQNPGTWLGSMLRLDVDRASPESPVDGRAYAVPTDNPFLGRAGVPPETWAVGLRNPWRFSFAPDGRMVVADVGQNLWEEVDLVAAGDNLGWNTREGRSCFSPKEGCTSEGLVDPVYAYGHDGDGASITGGYVYSGTAIPALVGRYVFGDFVSGRVWALDLPASVPGDAPVTSLGRFKALLSTFGRSADGELVVADFAAGAVYRLVPAGP